MNSSASRSQTPEQTRRSILEDLSKLIDPETGADVVRMKLIEDLVVDGSGQVSYTFQPSSPLCPIAVYLAVQIRMTVAGVPGVCRQQITVTNYVAAEKLTELINQEELFDLEEGSSGNDNFALFAS